MENSKVDESRKRAKTGGRVAGTPNKATAAVKQVAQEYTEQAIQVLVDLLQDKSTPPAARVAACREILDRGHGKPAVHVAGTDGVSISIINEFPD